MLKKILIANRGEIAVRIIRTARELGIATVAVYSDADAAAPHVQLADEAVHIGAAPATASYLDGTKIIDAARTTGAEAIHPGYGFLSENADFAAACAAAGVTFIGPSADVIRTMGSKREAKALMERNGVPVVPGFFGDVSDDELAQRAQEIGFPVLIKASAGGGGRGMRLVKSAGAFADALNSARREAKSAFADDSVLLEKYIERPRHIEVQIFGDQHGNVIHLFERDCSVQRRYQKLIEEAPAEHLNEEQREALYRAAVLAGSAAGYVGAGTVEFVVDEAGSVYFIEMNTRLQVEHPVTEMITGLDLVALQLRIAAGEHAPAQDEITAHGHAFELRLCAEDADRDFAPSTGVITHFALPGDDVRVDHGVGAGLAISPYYDSMIAKIIVHAADRTAALAKARAALEATRVVGVTTNRRFLHAILGHPGFVTGRVDTHFIDNEGASLLRGPTALDGDAVNIAAAYLVGIRQSLVNDAAADPTSPWEIHDAFRLNLAHREVLLFTAGDASHAVTVEHAHDGSLVVESDWGRHVIAIVAHDGSEIAVRIGARRIRAQVVTNGADVHVFAQGQHYALNVTDPLHGGESGDTAAGGLTAPMPGTVLEVFVEPGQQVAAGAPLLLIEAMKIEHTIAAPFDGTVTEVRFKAGDQIPGEGVELAVMEPD